MANHPKCRCTIRATRDAAGAASWIGHALLKKVRARHYFSQRKTHPERAFAAGCERFGFRLVHFSVQGNHIHMIVEAPDAEALARAMKGIEVRMARALNKVMDRSGPVFADRYHAHLLTSPREAANAVRYVLENWIVHAMRNADPAPSGVDPFCSAAVRECGPPLVAQPRWWLLCVGIRKRIERLAA